MAELTFKESYRTHGFALEIEGIVEQLDPAMNVGYALYADDGTLLYWSVSTDQRESEWPKFTPGRHIARCQLPPRFLNEGDYRLELIVSLHHRSWLVQPGVNAPSLSLAIQAALGPGAARAEVPPDS